MKDYNVFIRKIVTKLNQKCEPISKGVEKVHLGLYRNTTHESAIRRAALDNGYSLNCDIRAYEVPEVLQG